MRQKVCLRFACWLHWMVLMTLPVLLLAGCANVSADTALPGGKQEETGTLTVQFAANTLNYGHLQITLPDGVTVQKQPSGTDRSVVDLLGAQSVKREEGSSMSGPFPPRIWLAHYQFSYENEWELASVLLDLLSCTSLRILDREAECQQFFFTYSCDDKTGYVMVCEEDVYILEELSAESGYSLGGLFDDGAVLWKGSAQEAVGTERRIRGVTYEKCTPEEGISFLVLQFLDEDETRNVCLIRDGAFDGPAGTFSFAANLGAAEFRDCNFDGHTDMAVSKSVIYLWDVDQKAFLQAQVPDELESAWRVTYFSETGSVWSCDDDWKADRHWETLWRWEGTTLTKKRECTAKVQENDVRIWAYEDSPENCMFDEMVSVVEWNENSSGVQECYRRFYEGLIPQINDGNLHEIDYHQGSAAAIPQGLLDKITQSMRDKTELETLRGMINDTELSRDEALSLAENNLSLRSDVVMAEQWGDYILVRTDGDNDGIPDIIAELYMGGTAGFTEYVFYKGDRDGTYRRTSSYDSFREEFGFICYEGKNYLVRTLFDYGKKTYNGLSVTCYVDGEKVETIDLMLFPESYDAALTECADARYRALAEDILRDSMRFKDQIDGHHNIVGSSEKELRQQEYSYQCDLDNDGAPEKYNKSIWEPSNMGTYECLHFDGEGGGIDSVYGALKTVEGVPVMMWADPFEGKNVLHIISLTGLDDFEITGFLVEGASCQRLYCVVAKVDYGIRQERVIVDFGIR